jgi:NADH dehydrogenase FAD-containing subunit
MGSSPSAPQPPRFAAKSVVVIGGGLCGAAVASALDKDFAVTLVDNKPYCELTPCAIDVCLQPTKEALEARARAIRVPHKVYVKRGKVVLGR